MFSEFLNRVWIYLHYNHVSSKNLIDDNVENKFKKYR